MLRAFFAHVALFFALCVFVLGCSAPDHAGNATDEHVATRSLALGPCTTDADCGTGCGICDTNTGICSPAANTVVCRASVGLCDKDDKCDGSAMNCPLDAKEPGSTVCRASVGLCDAPETCAGGDNCPTDSKEPGTTVCRAPLGVCDAAETCAGGDNCPADVKLPNTTVCRVAADVCDAAENCNGGDTCPTDAFKDNTVTCRNGNGICDPAEKCTGSGVVCPANFVEPTSTACRGAAGMCDAVENCDGAGACPTDVKLPNTTQCRAAAGVCDAAENCNGGDNCPVDVKLTNATVCRAPAGGCDAPETCGSGDNCPVDVKLPGTSVCRIAAGVCDLAETCTGGDACPADVLKDTTVTCRNGSGICNPAEKCDGALPNCPADFLEPATTVCRAAGGVCDIEEKCDGVGACPTDVKNSGTLCRAQNGVCDKPDVCDGSNVNCPADAKLGATTTCRPAADVCDKAEVCNGTSSDCPSVDAKQPATTVCRPATLFCDVVENCDGTLDACPLDAFKAPTPCRAAVGLCDVAESCTGSSAACPPDAVQLPTFTCRASAGVCDIDEKCDGAGVNCPIDQFKQNSTSCRDADPAKQCDQAEFCPGNSPSCPTNIFKTAGTACNDGIGCTVSDACTAAGDCEGQASSDPAILEAACQSSQHVCALVTCDKNKGCVSTVKGSGSVCRAAAGTCDVVEKCTGASPDCPSDEILPNNTNCRASSCTNALLKPAIVCTGISAQCPTTPDVSCGNFACGSATDCRATCITSADCGTAFYCLNQDCVPRTGAGQPCKVDGECSGSNPYCIDGVCCDTTCKGQCEACNVAGKVGTCVGVTGGPVSPREKCAADGTKCDGFCDPSNHTGCEFPSKATSCRDASCDIKTNAAQAESFCTGKGSCALTKDVDCEPYACGAEACGGNCTADAQCATDAYCQAGKCTPKGTPADKCTTDKQCGSGHCADGVCCDTACTGQCEACSGVSGAKAGACSPVSGDPLGKKAVCAASDPACGGTCDGKNRLSCIYPAQGKVCRAGACADSKATVNAYCDGHGACPAALTVSCEKGCEGQVCSGDECALDSDCNDATKYCAAGVCSPKGAPGSACSASSACQTGFCTDGVCCDSACLGQCESCDAAGSMGACSAVPKGDSPHGGRTACAGDGSVCGGACDGTTRDSCDYPFDVVCRAGSCVAGAGADDPATSIVEASCLGNGSCPAEQQQLCGQDGCDGKNKVCAGPCALDKNACTSGQYCSAGECIPKLPPASTCANAAQCASNFCVDGVCCNKRCGEQCAACDVPGSVGTCTPVLGGTHGGRAACGGVGTCGAACDGAVVASCSFADDKVSCGEAFCSAGQKGGAPVCDGQGVCAPALTTACKSFACNGAECSTACKDNSDCVKEFECQKGECVAPVQIAAVDKGTCGCSVPGAGSRTPRNLVLLLGVCAVAVLRRRRRAA